jgi:hypothetical protein
MQHDDPVRALLHGLERPAPPPELETRTLAAAGAALRVSREADVWERVWSSRPLRLVWATSLLALLAGHAALSLRAALEGGARPTLAAARAELPAELRRIAELPPITLSGAWDPADEPGREPATPPINRTEVRR